MGELVKTYYLLFGSGNPSQYTGFSPTFIVFKRQDGTNVTPPPGITEVPSATGLYYFNASPSYSIAFVVDGGASLVSSLRYLSGSLDPIQAVDQTVGQPSDSYGSTSADPTSIFGYVKRNMEWNEGDSIFGKTSGAWDVYSRGFSTLLREKFIEDAAGASNVVKS